MWVACNFCVFKGFIYFLKFPAYCLGTLLNLISVILLLWCPLSSLSCTFSIVQLGAVAIVLFLRREVLFSAVVRWMLARIVFWATVYVCWTWTSIKINLLTHTVVCLYLTFSKSFPAALWYACHWHFRGVFLECLNVLHELKCMHLNLVSYFLFMEQVFTVPCCVLGFSLLGLWGVLMVVVLEQVNCQAAKLRSLLH